MIEMIVTMRTVIGVADNDDDLCGGIPLSYLPIPRSSIASRIVPSWVNVSNVVSL